MKHGHHGGLVDALENLQNCKPQRSWNATGRQLSLSKKKAGSIEKKKCSSVRVKISGCVGYLIRLYFP